MLRTIRYVVKVLPLRYFVRLSIDYDTLIGRQGGIDVPELRDTMREVVSVCISTGRVEILVVSIPTCSDGTGRHVGAAGMCMRYVSPKNQPESIIIMYRDADNTIQQEDLDNVTEWADKHRGLYLSRYQCLVYKRDLWGGAFAIRFGAALQKNTELNARLLNVAVRTFFSAHNDSDDFRKLVDMDLTRVHGQRSDNTDRYKYGIDQVMLQMMVFNEHFTAERGAYVHTIDCTRCEQESHGDGDAQHPSAPVMNPGPRLSLSGSSFSNWKKKVLLDLSSYVSRANLIMY